MNYLPPDEAKAMLLNILMDFAEDDTERLFEYFAHVGFDVPAPDNSKQISDTHRGFTRPLRAGNIKRKLSQ